MSLQVGSDLVLDWFPEPATGNTVPSEVTLEIRRVAPTLDAVVTITSSQFTTVGPDHYEYIYKIPAAGVYAYKWASSGTVNEAFERQFVVPPTAF